MKLKDALSCLNLTVDPEILSSYWEEDESTTPQVPELLEPAVFLAIREYLGISPEVDAELIAVAEQIRNDETLRQLWWHCCNLLFTHLDYPGGQVRNWPTLEERFGDRHGIFYMLVAFGAVPLTRELHRRLGVPEDMTQLGLSGNFHECVGNYRMLYSGQWGVDLRVIYWLRNDTQGFLFRLGRMEYMHRPYHGTCEAYRNRRTGEVVALSNDGMRYNAEGYIYGDLDADPSAWTASLIKSETTVTGNYVSPLGHATRQVLELSLEEWTCVLKPGDFLLEIHIPGGGGFAPDKCRDSMQRAAAFFSRFFPDKPYVGFGCTSWILNPKWNQVYRPDSNMVLWQQELYLYPVSSSGREGLHFLFARTDIDLATAPRDTSMRRAVLDWMASGKPLLAGGAFMLTEELGKYGTQPYRSQAR